MEAVMQKIKVVGNLFLIISLIVMGPPGCVAYREAVLADHRTKSEIRVTTTEGLMYDLTSWSENENGDIVGTARSAGLDAKTIGKVTIKKESVAKVEQREFDAGRTIAFVLVAPLIVFGLILGVGFISDSGIGI
jgi:hypothetical protein